MSGDISVLSLLGLLCTLGSLAALGPSRTGSCRPSGILVVVVFQDAVVKINQSCDWDVLSAALVLQDGLDGLLHLDGRHALVIFGSSLRHVQVQLEDVVELVSWVQISQTLGDS